MRLDELDDMKKVAKIVAVFFALAVLLWLGGTGFHVYENMKANSTLGGAASSSSVSSPPLHGYILLNLVLAGGDTMSLYHYNVGLNTLHKSSISFFTPRLSVDDQFVVGIAASSSDPQNRLGVWSFDISSHVTAQIVNFGKVIVRQPSMSSKGDIVLNMLANTISAAEVSTAAYTPESWGVWLVQKSASPVHVVDGLFPQWSPDGTEIIFLKHDGLHLYDLTSEKDTTVWPLASGSASSRMMFTVSRDGREIAWTNPMHDTVTVALVDTWHPFSAHIIRTVTVDALWPVISPDDVYVAFEQVDWQHISTSSEPTDPRLSMVNISTGAITQLHDLNKYDPRQIFISDWNDTESL